MKKTDYFEIQVDVKGGSNPMRELVRATCPNDALDKAKSKYRYIDAEISLVPKKYQKLKLNRSSPDPKRRSHRQEAN